MALTKVSTDGVKDDAITKTKIPANQIEASELADNAVDTNAIADQAVALSKLPHGTSSNNGKFLRANNGADPTFETVNTDLVSDTSPQLGGTLDSNGNVISLGDATGVNSNRIKLGAGNDFHIYHNGTNSTIREEGDGDLLLHTNNGSAIKLTSGSDENMVVANKDGAVELYHNNEKVLATDGSKVNVKQRIQIHNDAPASGHGMAIGQWDGSNHRIEGDANRPMVITSYNSGGIKMGVSGANKVAVTSDGLTFNGDTAAANALDDYEEGTFTPSSAAVTLTGTEGHYTKIGDLVTVQCIFVVPSTSNSSDIEIDGLPFNAKNGPSGSYIQGGNVTYHNQGGGPYTVLLANGMNRLVVYKADGARQTLDQFSDKNLRLMATYKVA